MDAVCSVLRANAWERLGQMEAAVGLLQQAMANHGASGRQAISKVISLTPSMQLCPQSFPIAQAQHTVAAGKVAGAAVGGGIGPLFLGIGVLCLIGSLVCLALIFGDLVLDFPRGAAMQSGVPLLTFLVLGFTFGGIGLSSHRFAARAERIRVHGLAGSGRVLNVSPTGMSINDVPQMAIRLLIELQGRVPYEATAKMMLSPADIGVLAPGTSVPVRVDPENLAEVLVETQ